MMIYTRIEKILVKLYLDYKNQKIKIMATEVLTSLFNCADPIQLAYFIADQMSVKVENPCNRLREALCTLWEKVIYHIPPTYCDRLYSNTEADTFQLKQFLLQTLSLGFTKERVAAMTTLIVLMKVSWKLFVKDHDAIETIVDIVFKSINEYGPSDEQLAYLEVIYTLLILDEKISRLERARSSWSNQNTGTRSGEEFSIDENPNYIRQCINQSNDIANIDKTLVHVNIRVRERAERLVSDFFEEN